MYKTLKSSVPKTQTAQKEGSDLTGIPKQMKLEFENRSGASLDDVRVQYNSEKPAQLQALAYTQGSRIYIAPGQERHLRHELVHVIQQKQGRVQATARVNGMAVNDEERLEREADLGQIPVQMKAGAGVVQAMGADGHLGPRSEFSDRMYNKSKFRWGYYTNLVDLKGKRRRRKTPIFNFNQRVRYQTVVDAANPTGTTIHHIIPYQTLRQFWDIIVDYYPDLWGGMVKNVLKKADKILLSGRSVYLSNYKNRFLVHQNIASSDIEKEIDREAAILKDRAFRGGKESLLEKRPDNMEGLDDLISAVYSWMPGNLVIGASAEKRGDDPNSSDIDAPALRQKGLEPGSEKQYKALYNQIRDFISKLNAPFGRNMRLNLHEERKKAVKQQAYRGDPSAMENEARKIINQIARLLAGHDITNKTIWKSEGEKYTSPNEITTIKVKR